MSSLVTSATRKSRSDLAAVSTASVKRYTLSAIGRPFALPLARRRESLRSLDPPPRPVKTFGFQRGRTAGGQGRAGQGRALPRAVPVGEHEAGGERPVVGRAQEPVTTDTA